VCRERVDEQIGAIFYIKGGKGSFFTNHIALQAASPQA
jgi:hypothetical protein